MNSKEGIRRMRLLAKRLMILGCAAGAVAIWLAILAHWVPAGMLILPICAIVAFWGILAGSFLWVLAWIIDGFLSDAV